MSEVLVSVLIAVLIIAIVASIGAAVYFIKIKLVAFLEQNDIGNAEKIVKFVMDNVEKVVIELNETVVKSLKAAASDGKITAEEGKAILDEAIDKVKAQISDVAQSILSVLVGDIDLWIKSAIETSVKANKYTLVNGELLSQLFASNELHTGEAIVSPTIMETTFGVNVDDAKQDNDMQSPASEQEEMLRTFKTVAQQYESPQERSEL